MKKSIILGLAFAAGILAWESCQKDSTTETTPSLSGLTISESIPYVAKGTDLVFEADFNDIISSDGTDPGVLGLIWQVNSEEVDTLSYNLPQDYKPFSFHVEELGSYTIKCYAYSNKGGYYSASASTTFNAVDPDTALTGLEGSPETAVGSIQVRTATIGGAVWMSQNLFGTDSGIDYKSSSVISPLFGRYYTWDEAMTACPAGWHLPSAAEWDALGTDAGALMAKAVFLEEDMWKLTQNQNITNTLKFNAIPVGYIDNSASYQAEHGFGQYAAFWTADAADADRAHFRYIRYDEATVSPAKGDKSTMAMSVRCVKD